MAKKKKGLTGMQKQAEASKLRYSLAKHGETMYKNKDLLENLYIVRKFVHYKYNIKIKLLDLLLTLYPKGYFNHWDYRKIDKDFTYMHVDKLIEEGWIEETVLYKGRNRSTKYPYCYGPTKKMHEFIDEFYGLLAGEYSFPKDWSIEDARLNRHIRNRKPKAINYLNDLVNLGYLDKDPNPKEIYFKPT